MMFLSSGRGRSTQAPTGPRCIRSAATSITSGPVVKSLLSAPHPRELGQSFDRDSSQRSTMLSAKCSRRILIGHRDMTGCPRRDKPPPEGQPPRSALLHSIRVEIHVDVSEIRMCRCRRPLQGTSRDLANELERIRRSHPRRSPTPPSQLESLQSSSCFPRRRSSLTVRCGE